jgi:flagellar biosynthesis protein FlhG
MTDQAAILRGMVGEVKKYPKVVTFASGKGGVGKSNLITALAILMGEQNTKVTLLDMDLGLANLDILLGLNPRFNLAHVMAGQKKIREIVCPGPNNIMLVPGASGVSRLANLNSRERKQLSEKFSELEKMSDIVLVDTGAGLGENVLHFATASQAMVVVTTPEPPARMDAYALIKTAMAKAPDLSIHVIINEAASEAQAKAVFKSLSEVSRQHLPRLPKYLGYVPLDPHVSQSVGKRRPFVLAYPNSVASRAMRKIERDLSAFLLPHRGTSDDRLSRSFFSRLFSAFSLRSV